ncbi:amino acid deaminase [Microbacterium lushaniae]|nr:amino acid deaminase [Microbacterium lushaniae]KAA9155347.1 amino acid deaminase [Microbacterium lushaniae]
MTTSGSFSDDIRSAPVDPWGKVKARGLDGVPRERISALGLTVDGFATPLLTIDAGAVAGNAMALEQWCHERGFRTAPHGKTTMAPQIWQRQMSAGSWGITVATEAQLDIAWRAGVPRLQLANNLVRPEGVRTLRERLQREPQREVLVWVDSVAAVEALRSDAGPEIAVLLDVGWPGGRTGVRDAAEAAAVVDAVRTTTGVRLVGTAGYEGAIGPAEADAHAPMADYLRALLHIHRSIVQPECAGEMYLSIAGSDQLDEVGRALAACPPKDGVVLIRSGMSIVHDHGLYARQQEHAPPGVPRFRPALALVSTVLSVHEGARAILDVGRRDAGHDHGLPVALEVWRDGAVVERLPAPLEVSALNDQHAFLDVSTFSERVRVGDKVVCGVSHSCTTMDRWRDIVEISGPVRPDEPVVGLIRTLF